MTYTSDSAFICSPLVVSRCFQESSDVEQDYTKLSDILKATRQVLSCWPFVTVTLAASMDTLVITSAVAFMPKILQSKFRLTPGRAALLYGCSSIPAALFGNIAGKARSSSLKPFPLRQFGSNNKTLLCLENTGQIQISPLNILPSLSGELSAELMNISSLLSRILHQ